MQSHQSALMRTTIDLPEDLHHIALALAADSRRTLSQMVAELMRRGLAPSVRETRAAYHVDKATGLPVVRSKRSITAKDVKALDDEP